VANFLFWWVFGLNLTSLSLSFVDVALTSPASKSSLRQADTSSDLLEIKFSKSLLDLNAASAQMQILPNLKHVRRFSEPANIRKHRHAPLTPLIFPKSPMSRAPSALNIAEESQLRKARSFSLYDPSSLFDPHPIFVMKSPFVSPFSHVSKKPGLTFQRKIAHKGTNRTFDGKPPQYIDSYFLAVRLPSDTYMTIQVGFTLFFVCSAQF